VPNKLGNLLGNIIADRHKQLISSITHNAKVLAKILPNLIGQFLAPTKNFVTFIQQHCLFEQI